MFAGLTLVSTMKTFLTLLVAGAVCFPILPTYAESGKDVAPEVHKLNWPRVFTNNPNMTLTMYQPEIEKWEGNTFNARSAISVQPKGQDTPIFGVVWLTARIDVDKGAGIITLSDIKFTKLSFPGDPAKSDMLLAAMQKQIPAKPLLLPLGQVDNKYLLSDAMPKPETQPVKNDPPMIIFSKEASLLVLVDGEPVMRPVSGADCQRVLNTRAVILQGTNGGPFYLRALKYWFQADSLAGPWKPTTKTPANIIKAATSLVSAKQADPIDPPNGQDRPAAPPVVYVSTTPAELVQTKGEPQFVPIPETQLLEVKNSANAIILDVSSQSYYVLISGRWFSSTALTGPWAFVEGGALPADFAKIPADSDKSNVLVSVPNTAQAQEAVLANSIPQTATVKRKEAKLTVKYDGKPDFKPIEGTPMKYAVNTSLPVIAVAPDAFFCVANAVWFAAKSPMGPWVVATEVPPVIYTIPISSPIHYVTYVHIYGYTDDVVYVGYTPGYYGTVVSATGTVVYGTGYSYPVYAGETTYVAQPATYGYGAGFADGAVSGFAFGFVAAACTEPYWGPYCYGTGTVNVNINNGNIYNNWPTSTVTHTNAYGPNGGSFHSTTTSYFNPYTGNWGGTRNSSATGPNGGSATRSGEINGNSYNGNWTASQNTSVNGPNGGHGQSHTSASGNSNTGQFDSATTRSGETGNGAKGAGVTTDHNGDVNRTGAAYNPNTGNGVVYHDGNVYTDKDGNVYKHTDDGWQTQSQQNGWQNANRNSANESQYKKLDQQQQGWRQGNQRFQQQQNLSGQTEKGSKFRGGGEGEGEGSRERGGGGGFHRR